MNFEALRNLIHREVLRVLDRRTRPMPCIVDAYDPNTFTVKVRLQPSDTLTGWIQIKQEATGNLFGVQIAPNIGDPGWLEFHEDDPRAAIFAGTVSNQKFPAMVIQAGEMMWKTKWGQSIYLKADGSLTLTDKASTIIKADGAGNATVTATTAITVHAPAVNIGNGGTLQPVKLADNTPSTVLKAE